MKVPAVLKSEVGQYAVLGIVGVIVLYYVGKKIAAAAAQLPQAAANAVSQAPAAAINAAGSGVGNALDAIGENVLGKSAYDSIPDTWGGVWDDIKGWFGGSSNTTTTPTEVTGAANAATTQDQLGAAAFNGTPDLAYTDISDGSW